MKNVSQIMQEVMLALIPGTMIMAWFFGPGILANVVLACISAIAFETLALALRRKPVSATLLDGTALLAGWLLALAFPPWLPWWIILLGTSAAMLLGKHVYGGLGFNPFNPAMVGYACLIISFPREMTAWTAPAITPGLWDAITMATPLDQLKTAMNQSMPQVDTQSANQWSVWQWINLGFLFGGLFLLIRKIISWHIPAALLVTLASLTLIDYVFFSSPFSPITAVFSGAAMLGAFFIATDPVSAATSPRGRIVYAAGIGILIFCIRKWGAYPEGVAFAVLLMNFTAPAIDYYYRPRAFGE